MRACQSLWVCLLVVFRKNVHTATAPASPNAQFGNDFAEKKVLKFYVYEQGHKLRKGKNALFILPQIFMFVFLSSAWFFFSLHFFFRKFSVSLADEAVVVNNFGPAFALFEKKIKYIIKRRELWILRKSQFKNRFLISQTYRKKKLEKLSSSSNLSACFPAPIFMLELKSEAQRLQAWLNYLNH